MVRSARRARVASPSNGPVFDPTERYRSQKARTAEVSSAFDVPAAVVVVGCAGVVVVLDPRPVVGGVDGVAAAPAANRFGKVSPTTAAHVVADLGNRVDYILDGGACPVGVESTVVDCSVVPAQILRPGAITAEQVSALLHGELAPALGPAARPG